MGFWGGPLESSEGKGIADDIGKLGKTYKISETDILEMIMKDVASGKVAGKVEKMTKELKERSTGYAKRPRGILLPRAERPKRLVYDPTVTLLADIRDANGRVIFPAGTTANPLNVIRSQIHLCFIDGDDEDQIAWMLKNCDGELKAKVVLVNGSPLDLGQKMKRKIYFDQGSILVSKFGITALPAVVTNGERVLNVDEVPLN